MFRRAGSVTDTGMVVAHPTTVMPNASNPANIPNTYNLFFFIENSCGLSRRHIYV
jgi:hypothetical protein